MIFYIILPFIIPLIYSIELEKDMDYELLLHLKPQTNQNLESYDSLLQNFNNLIEEYITDDNLTAYYNYLVSYSSNNTQTKYWPLSIFYSWGLGIKYDPRIALININFGVLTDDFLSILSNFYKTLNGVSTVSACESVIPSMKPLLYEMVNNFSLFEQRELEQLSLNSQSHSRTNYEYFNSLILDLDALTSTSNLAISKFFRKYFSTYINVNKSLTKKLYSYLENLYKSSDSYEAAAYLGFLNIESGGAINIDYEAAFTFSTIANKHNIPFSNLVLGLLHFYGLGLPINHTLSFKYFEKAIEHGLHEATPYLGIHYLAGLGVIPDSTVALKYIMIGTSHKYLLSIYTLALMHEYGLGVFHSCDFASQLYNMIIEHKLLSKTIKSAIEDFKKYRITKSFYKLLSMADLGSPSSMMNAAYILEKESFYFYNQEERNRHLFRLWNQASKQGIVEATVKVGDAYFSGRGVKQDYSLALSSYRYAVNSRSNPQAIFNIAYMYEIGLGVDKNYNTAERYYDMVLAADSDSFFLVSLALLRLRFKMNCFSFNKLIHHYFDQIHKSYYFTKEFMFHDSDSFILFISSIFLIVLIHNFYTRYTI